MGTATRTRGSRSCRAYMHEIPPALPCAHRSPTPYPHPPHRVAAQVGEPDVGLHFLAVLFRPNALAVRARVEHKLGPVAHGQPRPAPLLRQKKQTWCGAGGGGVRGTRGQRQTPSSSPAPTAPADRPLAARGKRGGTRSTRRTRDPSGWGEGRRAARACATKMGAAKAARRTRGPFGQGEGCGRLLSTCSTKVGAVGRSGLQVKPLLAVTSSWKASCAW